MGKKLWYLIELIVRFLLSILFRVIHKDLLEETTQAFLQFVKFGLIGVTNTLVSYVLYAFAMLSFELLHWQIRFDYVIANGFAFVLSVFWSWFWNSRLVFKAEDGERRIWWKTLLRAYVAYAFTGLFLNNVISWLWIDIMHAPKLLAPAPHLSASSNVKAS